MSAVPGWQALLAELAAAPADPVTAAPVKSIKGVWVLWFLVSLLVPLALVLGGGSLPKEITDAFPWIALPLLLVVGVVVFVMQQRSVRAYNADLALFGLAQVGDLPSQLQLSGRRWGRAVWVTVDLPSKPAGTVGASTILVVAPSPRFELVGEGGRLLARYGAPPQVLGLLGLIGGAGPWDDVTVSAGPDGIRVRRGPTWSWLPDVERSRRWLYDLWLAERLAFALASTSGPL